METLVLVAITVKGYWWGWGAKVGEKGVGSRLWGVGSGGGSGGRGSKGC